MPDEPQNDVRSQLVRSLMSKIADDPYPSASMMDTVEELLTPEERPAYVRTLLERIDGDRFPSIPMIDRIQRLAE